MTTETVARPARASNPRALAQVAMEGGIWVLADRRAGTVGQPLGIVERLGLPYRLVPVYWRSAARIPWPWPTLAGLNEESRHGIAPPWPSLVLSAGRRSAPVARWLRGRGAKLVHCNYPDFAPTAFDLLVVGRHDNPHEAKNVFPILGACHRISPRTLAQAREEWAEFASLPSPRIALLVGGPVRSEGLDPAVVIRLAGQVKGLGGSVLASTSRRTGSLAGGALAGALEGTPHRLYRYGEHGRNPYAGMLAWADAIVVTADSVSMLSETLMVPAPVYLADPGGLPKRHQRFAESLVAAGQARWLAPELTPFERASLDETARVATEIRARGLI